MKINEIKHNHSLTDLLKVLLFSILMLLPFIDVGVRCGYVMLNKNAYQSYYGETINETKSIYYEDNDNLAINTTTYFTSDRTTTLVNSQINIDVENFKIISSSIDLTNYVIEENVSMIQIMNNGTINPYIRFKNSDTIMYDLSLVNYTLLFQFDTLNNANVYNFGTHFYTNEYNKYSYLDNVFDYSVSQLEESNLYNWTTQTAIYSGVSQMTTELGITTNIIPIILCYWFFITIIYIILDIVIKLFTILTHFIGSKTSS